MDNHTGHVPDHELLMAADGELPRRRALEVAEHLESCWTCRTRLHELESAIGDVVRAYQTVGRPIPPPEGPRALLRAEMRQRAERGERDVRRHTTPLWMTAAAIAAVIGGAALLVTDPTVPVPGRVWIWGVVGNFIDADLHAGPDPVLTPGATAPVSETEICDVDPGGNDSSVPPTVGRVVFAAYGIRDPQPGAYELDYLIAPELGGSDEVSNLWPQPYSESVWNARVKDALEEHLHRLVCNGQVALRTAQDEIAADWISAYKKHFDTEFPIAAHTQFVKDRPWTR